MRNRNPYARRTSTGFLAIIAGITLWLLWVLISEPQVNRHRPSKSAICKNNIRQIAIALCNYQDEWGSFPPAYIADENGKPMHSWRVLILPLFGEEALYNKYRFDEPWNGPNNRKLVEHIPSVYRCPSHEGASFTSYVAIVGPNTTIRIQPNDVYVETTDDFFQSSIMLTEIKDFSVNWMEPTDISPQDFLAMFRNGKELNHPKEIIVGMSSGGTLEISKTVPPANVNRFLAYPPTEKSIRSMYLYD